MECPTFWAPPNASVIQVKSSSIHDIGFDVRFEGKDRLVIIIPQSQSSVKNFFSDSRWNHTKNRLSTSLEYHKIIVHESFQWISIVQKQLVQNSILRRV